MEEKVEGAETLAYLIEEDLDLQSVASITDHLILTLAAFLRYIPESTNKNVSTALLVLMATATAVAKGSLCLNAC